MSSRHGKFGFLDVLGHYSAAEADRIPAVAERAPVGIIETEESATGSCSAAVAPKRTRADHAMVPAAAAAPAATIIKPEFDERAAKMFPVESSGPVTSGMDPVDAPATNQLLEHHGVKRGTLSMSQYAASAASSWSSTSAKLLRCVKDVPDASARRLQLNP